MKCKHCDCEEFYEEARPPHVGLYCCSCKKWQQWVKKDTTGKTKEDYKAEYLTKELATDQQRTYIRNLLRQNKLNKYQADQIIRVLGGETV